MITLRQIERCLSEQQHRRLYRDLVAGRPESTLSLDAVDFTKITTAQVMGLSTTSVGQLTDTQVAGLHVSQLRALTGTQMSAFSTTEIGAFDTTQAGSLTSTQIGAMSTTAFSALSETTVFTPSGPVAVTLAFATAAPVGSKTVPAT